MKIIILLLCIASTLFVAASENLNCKICNINVQEIKMLHDRDSHLEATDLLLYLLKNNNYSELYVRLVDYGLMPHDFVIELQISNHKISKKIQQKLQGITLRRIYRSIDAWFNAYNSKNLIPYIKLFRYCKRYYKLCNSFKVIHHDISKISRKIICKLIIALEQGDQQAIDFFNGNIPK
ncbi:MAG: hypothetical protein P4L22_04695 [Candidatus Babeliales bacterium]|nr:hypothetical protein [Candidatus Babeliales bacterium]